MHARATIINDAVHISSASERLDWPPNYRRRGDEAPLMRSEHGWYPGPCISVQIQMYVPSKSGLGARTSGLQTA
jgi:hypothetical protein